MSQFYARYIPPSSSSALPTTSSVVGRKRSATKPDKPKESKKRRVEQQNGDEVLAKYSSTSSRQEHENANIKKRAENKSRDPSLAYRDILTAGDGQPKGLNSSIEKRRKRENPAEKEPESAARPEAAESQSRDSPDVNAKHARVLSRFRDNALPTEEQSKAVPTDGLPDTVAYHDLEPIPQPTVSTPKVLVNYSTAPEWLRRPIQVNSIISDATFKELRVETPILQNLEAQDKAQALPVQSTVLPLLLHKDVHQRHDLCVAAATGSGKTLAYVIPILNDLRKRSVVQLRAVIVVPTRALVKQVVQTIESCSAGTDVKVGTAEGSKALQEEQRQLVDESRILDLEEWQKRRDTPFDWSTFSLEETITQAKQTDVLADIGHVTHYNSKVDILVCTPGRLVEHLQTTKGFNLDNVNWFIADEADRLLNESYHEWLEAVLPALKSSVATQQRDDLLRSMYMDVPPRRVTKILLSATMTRDVSQLLLLELTDPRLVVMVDSESQTSGGILEASEDQADFSVPNQLEEIAIPFKDSENKPLYLLQLLNQHILPDRDIGTDGRHKVDSTARIKKQVEDSTSSSGSSSSESEDDPSDASDTSHSDSESDTDSVSSTSTSSSDSSALETETEIETKAASPSTSISTSMQGRVLIFTKSTESAHRLSRLLSLLQPSLTSKIASFSKSSSSTQSSSVHKIRSKILQSFSSGKTPLLICTDLAARGLDIPSLEHVVNYDVPSSALTYVHRVGRTARAGREGKAWTLVEHKQGKWFWETIGGKLKAGDRDAGAENKIIGRGNKVVQKLNLVLDLPKWTDRYEEALSKLSEDVRGR